MTLFDAAGRPVQITPRSPVEGVNLTYDQQGHLARWTRGDFALTNVYEEKTGYLVERRMANRNVFRYIYKNGNKVRVSLSERRVWKCYFSTPMAKMIKLSCV